MDMQASTIIAGVSDLSDSYETFILDQWGVLHFGQTAPSFVIDTLTHLRERGKTAVILSNSGKSASYSRKRLTELGISGDLYTDIVTSGEMVRQGIQSGEGPVFKNLGQNCLIISNNGDTSTVEGLDLSIVDDPASADFVLLVGCENHTRPVESYEPLLRACAAKSLRMICANPDMVAVEGDKTFYGPGQIAARYNDFGGVVHYVGKPHKPIFAWALSRVKEGLPSTTMMVGDSMGHDILGGAAMGFDTCLTMTGAHAALFNSTGGERDQINRAVDHMARQYGVRPTYVVPRFAWGNELPDRKNKRKS